MSLSTPRAAPWSGKMIQKPPCSGSQATRIHELERAVTSLIDRTTAQDAELAGLRASVATVEDGLTQQSLLRETAEANTNELRAQMSSMATQMAGLTEAITKVLERDRSAPAAAATTSQPDAPRSQLQTACRYRVDTRARIVVLGDSNVKDLPLHYRRFPGFTALLRTYTMYESIDAVKDIVSASSAVSPVLFICHTSTNDVVDNSVQWMSDRVTELEAVVSDRFPGAKFVLVAPPPRRDTDEYASRIDDWLSYLRSEACRLPVRFVDYPADLDRLLQSDGLHLSRSGVEILMTTLVDIATEMVPDSRPLRSDSDSGAAGWRPRVRGPRRGGYGRGGDFGRGGTYGRGGGYGRGRDMGFDSIVEAVTRRLAAGMARPGLQEAMGFR
jgi:hypothetical protein